MSVRPGRTRRDTKKMECTGDMVSRREVLGGMVAVVVAGVAGRGDAVAVRDFELEEMTIEELSKGMEEGRFSARGLVEKYLGRIEALDRKGPTLGHVIEVNPEAREIAERLDRARKEKGARGRLHGVPILLKDNIDTGDRMGTTAGSWALAEKGAGRDAFLVKRLREAGVVILGKANMSEWANFRSTRSTSGWSARGGQGRNPYALDRTPSGSSSGSAGGVAADYCAAAVGTETDGSIVSPASCCGVVGIKPTVGLVSRSGIVPIAHSQDTAGPIARTVADAAILLGGMVGMDGEDEAMVKAGDRGERDYSQYLKRDGLRGARIGVVRKGFGFGPKTEAVLETAVAAMKSEGAIVVDPVEVATVGKFGDAETEVLLYEFKAGLEKYLAGRQGVKFGTLMELIEFNLREREWEMPYFGQELFVKAEGKGGLESGEYVEALKKCRRMARDEGIDQAMAENRLDALVAMTTGPATLIDLVNGDYDSGGSSSLAAVAGYPSVTVPAGYVMGLPVGVSFMGRAFAEGVLVRLAYGFEQATKVRRSPGFGRAIELRAAF